MKKWIAIFCALLMVGATFLSCQEPEKSLNETVDTTIGPEDSIAIPEDTVAETETTAEGSEESRNETESAIDETAEPVETEAPFLYVEPEEAPMPMPEGRLVSLTIDGVSIEEYTIVYASSAELRSLEKVNNVSREIKDYFNDYLFDKICAQRLADAIYALTGMEIPVKEDDEAEESGREILVGLTDRPQTLQMALKAMETDFYRIAVNEGDLVICGGVYGNTWHAVEYLREEMYRAATETGEYEILSDYDHEGEHTMLRIGCIGDSITDGMGATVTALDYASQLGMILWKDAVVKEYGDPGKTMYDGNDAYRATKEYERALKDAPQTDIFTIMMGTNDADHFPMDWAEEQDGLYTEALYGILEALQEQNPDLQFFLAGPPESRQYKIRESCERIRALVESLIPQLNDDGYPTKLVDVYAATKGEWDHFSDRLHPNDAGHRRIAEAWAMAIFDTVNELKSAK